VIQIKRRGRRLRLKYREGNKCHYIEAVFSVVLTEAVAAVHEQRLPRYQVADQMHKNAKETLV
jgi:hypothetical protein